MEGNRSYNQTKDTDKNTLYVVYPLFSKYCRSAPNNTIVEWEETRKKGCLHISHRLLPYHLHKGNLLGSISSRFLNVNPCMKCRKPVCIVHAPNEKDAMTSSCLDRKEVRGAIWGVHSTMDRPACGGIMHSYKMTFSVFWRAGLHRPD